MGIWWLPLKKISFQNYWYMYMFNESFAQLVKQLGIAANVSNVAHGLFVIYFVHHTGLTVT